MRKAEVSPRSFSYFPSAFSHLFNFFYRVFALYLSKLREESLKTNKKSVILDKFLMGEQSFPILASDSCVTGVYRCLMKGYFLNNHRKYVVVRLICSEKVLANEKLV